METNGGPSAADAVPGASPPTAEAASPSQTTQSPEERLRALEAKTAAWKEAVAAQLNDAARKNKKLREELRVVRDDKETALSELRVQLTEEFQERTAMQREELAALQQQATLLREEKKSMAAAHEAELQKTRVQLREVIQLEVATDYKRREEQWEKEKAALQARAEAKETERVQAEHECEVMKVRLSRLGAQYEELASLLQPSKDGTTNTTASATAPTQTSTKSEGGGGATSVDALQDPSRQQSAVNAAFAQQLESIKAELQSKEQHTQFMLERARQEHEAEKAQLLRELQLREEELKVAHTLLKQVQAESSGYLQRVSHAQTERQATEQRYAAKVSTLSAELAERMRSLDEAQAANRRLVDQLRTAQQQVVTLEEESTMREEAFHSLMLSESDKRAVMDMQRAVQSARDEAAEWQLRYYNALSAHPTEGEAGNSGSGDGGGAASAKNSSDAAGRRGHASSGGSGQPAPGAAVGQDTLSAREAALAEQAAELERKEHLLAAAEAKLNDMRRSMASQASLLLQQQQQQQKGGRRDRGGFREGEGDTGNNNTYEGDDDGDRDMMDASPLISTAASLLPTSLHGSLRTLEGHRRRLHLPGSCRCLSCFFSGGGVGGAPLRLRRNPLLLTLAVLLLTMFYLVMGNL